MFNINKVNYFVFILLYILSKALIIFLNNKSNSYFKEQSNSLDRFETIMFNKDGNNLIKADKLIYIDDKQTLLQGESSLKNENYEVKSFDILINFSTGNAESSHNTNLNNRNVNVISEGFKFNNSTRIINFVGKTVVTFLNE